MNNAASLPPVRVRFLILDAVLQHIKVVTPSHALIPQLELNLRHVKLLFENPVFIALGEFRSGYLLAYELAFIEHVPFTAFIRQLIYDGFSIPIITRVFEVSSKNWSDHSKPEEPLGDSICATLRDILTLLSELPTTSAVEYLQETLLLPRGDRIAAALEAIMRILDVLRDHFLSASSPVVSKQAIVDILHPVCSDVAVDVDFRLSLLKQLEVSQMLATNDKLKQLFYKVEALALEVCPLPKILA